MLISVVNACTQIQFRKMPVDQSEVEVEQLVAKTSGFSGAEVCWPETNSSGYIWDQFALSRVG